MAWVAGVLADFTITCLLNEDGNALTGSRYGDLQGYTLVTAAMPEPSFWILLSVAAGAIILLRRRRKN